MKKKNFILTLVLAVGFFLLTTVTQCNLAGQKTPAPADTTNFNNPQTQMNGPYHTGGHGGYHGHEKKPMDFVLDDLQTKLNTGAWVNAYELASEEGKEGLLNLDPNTQGLFIGRSTVVFVDINENLVKYKTFSRERNYEGDLKLALDIKNGNGLEKISIEDYFNNWQIAYPNTANAYNANKYGKFGYGYRER